MGRNFGGSNGFLADRLRQARLQAGYSQQNIADALNVNRATYTYYETGKTTPDPVTLGRIARICGAPIEFFFEEEPVAPLLLTDRERCPKKAMPDPSRPVARLSKGQRGRDGGLGQGKEETSQRGVAGFTKVFLFVKIRLFSRGIGCKLKRPFKGARCSSFYRMEYAILRFS